MRYHVTGQDYHEGTDLLSFDALGLDGETPEWKWEDGQNMDTDVVCLFDTLAEAEDFRAEYQPAGRILAVDLPDDYRTTTVGEGYTAVYDRIPAEHITAL
jgi:hypothetical protein